MSHTLVLMQQIGIGGADLAFHFEFAHWILFFVLPPTDRKFYCLRQVHLAENLPRATHTQNRVETT